MSDVKIVINSREGRYLVGLGKPDCDPQLFAVEGELEQVLAQVPELIRQAGEKWSQSSRNPATTIVTTPLPVQTPATGVKTTKAAAPREQQVMF
jgi:hypothetical protein